MDKNEYRTLGPVEKRVWKDAFGIAWIGASNPSGVAKTLFDDLCGLREELKDRSISDKHPAIRAMASHLLFLTGGPDLSVEPIGPDLELVTRTEAYRMAIESETEKENANADH